MKIVVLHTHGFHLSYLGCYGNEWVTTPNLDRLAADGIVFDQHYADDPSPLQDVARRSTWTGRYRLPRLQPQPEQESPSLADILKNHDVPHKVLSPGQRDWPQIGDAIVRAVDRIASRERGLVWAELPGLAPPWQVPEEAAEAYFDEEPAADSEDAEPVTPWLDPPVGPLDRSAWQRLQATYAAAITYFDAELGVILDELRGGNDTMICVTAANGLALGEHGVVGPHRAWMHEEVWHVPLILEWPGAAQAGLRIPALTQTVDLVPTLLDALGLPAENMQGRSLLPLIRGEVAAVRAYAVGGLRVGDSIEWALRTPEWALLLPVQVPAGDPPRQPQLYVKPDDRWEVNDVRQHHLEFAEGLEQTLHGIVEATEKKETRFLEETGFLRHGDAS